MKRKTIQDIARLKKSGNKIACLTAYSAPIARILDKYVDLILVGDSLATTCYGMNTTIGISLDTMINHTKAIVDSTSNALVILDLPFSSYEVSKEQAFVSASRALIQTGCAGVKLEGGVDMQETIAFLTSRGIPVMAHVGLMPQHINIYGSFAKREEAAIIDDIKAVEEAGAFAVVIENVSQDIVEEIIKHVKIPTIGIGASEKCDGQILVTDDILGLSEKTPPFAKVYVNLKEVIEQGVSEYTKYCRGL